MRLRHLLALVVSFGCVAAAAGAQAPATYRQRASANLLGIPFGVASLEYEATSSPEVSFGASMGVDADSHAWAEGKVRYYPSARGPRGFAVGLSAGAARVRAFTEEDCVIFCSDASGPTATAATLGVFLDYSWLIGRSRRFYIGTGIGAKRAFGLDESETDAYRYSEVLGAGRLQIGYAF
jgi:hypothetical protein